MTHQVLPPTGGIDGQEMLLKLIDSKLEVSRAEGAARSETLRADIAALTASIAPRLDTHERRISNLEDKADIIEDRLDDVKSRIDGVAEWVKGSLTTLKLVRVGIVALIVIAGYFGYKLSVSDVAHTRTTLEQTITIPEHDARGS